MLIPHGTVIAVIDGQDWDLFRNAGTEAEPELAVLETPALAEHNHSTSGHSASRSRPSLHDMDETAHAAAVAEWLNGQVTAHKIDRLAIIATPRTLGELRHHLSAQASQVLIAEVAKDLMGRQPADLIAALRAK